MENTSMRCGTDVRKNLGIFKNESTSRSVNNILQQLDFDPKSIQDVFLPAKAPPSLSSRTLWRRQQLGEQLDLS